MKRRSWDRRWTVGLAPAVLGIGIALAQGAGAQQNALDARQAALQAAGNTKGGSVNVLAVWGGAELENFRQVVKPFEDATGIRVNYEGTRDLNAVLTTRVQGGNPPDVAGLPGPGQLEEFAQAGKLVALNNVVDLAKLRREYGQSWIDLGSVNDRLYGVFVGASLKGLVWYNPKQYKGPTAPKTWNELNTWARNQAQQGTTPWCVGVESGAASGWVGTDWIENFFLRQSGPQAYDRWYRGQLPWTSPEVKAAFQAFGSVVTDPKMVFGGPTTVLSTNFGDAGAPMFTNPPKCYLHQQATFIADFFSKIPNVKPVEDFNFFALPDINPQFAGTVEAGGDIFGMFKDTPQARALLKYLTSPAAQAIWVKTGQTISPNKAVPASQYPTALSRRAAQILGGAKTVRFDASDLMPAEMNEAFWKAILNYIQNPGQLDQILANLETVRKSAYK